MITAVSVQLSISKAKNPMIQLPTHCGLQRIWIIVPEKMQKAKQVMALVSSFRFPINFLRKHVKKRESKSARKENMVLASSFSHSMRSNVPRQKKCLRSLWKKRDWSSLAGEKFRQFRRFLDIRQESACHALCRHLSKSRMIWKKASHLTVNCILPAVSLNRVMTTLTYVL